MYSALNTYYSKTNDTQIVQQTHVHPIWLEIKVYKCVLSFSQTPFNHTKRYKSDFFNEKFDWIPWSISVNDRKSVKMLVNYNPSIKIPFIIQFSSHENQVKKMIIIDSHINSAHRNTFIYSSQTHEWTYTCVYVCVSVVHTNHFLNIVYTASINGWKVVRVLYNFPHDGTEIKRLNWNKRLDHRINNIVTAAHNPNGMIFAIDNIRCVLMCLE